MTNPVAVGYDGSPPSQAALETAVTEARARAAPLRVLYGAPVSPMAVPFTPAWYMPLEEDERSDVNTVAAQARERLTDIAGDLDYEVETAQVFSPAGTLIARSREFELLVMGSRGRGGFGGLLLGSTSSQVAAHAHCTVLVVRPRASEGPHTDSIVVGVDGSDRAPAVLRFAFDAAVAHQAPLTAVHIWHVPHGANFDETALDDNAMSAIQREEATVLTQMLRSLRAAHPEVPVTEVNEAGTTRPLLLRHGKGSRMIVVGSHGHEPLLGILLGSTSQAMLHHAEAPVAVVHQA